jgi:predicted RNase H-like HicB family nuclease
MISSYIDSKLKIAAYKILPDGSYFGKIQGIKGIWANARTLEACRRELAEVLEGWILLKVRFGEKIPGLPLVIAKGRQLRNA